MGHAKPSRRHRPRAGFRASEPHSRKPQEGQT